MYEAADSARAELRKAECSQIFERERNRLLTVFCSQHIVLDMRVYTQSTMSEMSLINVYGEL